MAKGLLLIASQSDLYQNYIPKIDFIFHPWTILASSRTKPSFTFYPENYFLKHLLSFYFFLIRLISNQKMSLALKIAHTYIKQQKYSYSFFSLPSLPTQL
jgi:hypothetical protein